MSPPIVSRLKIRSLIIALAAAGIVSVTALAQSENIGPQGAARRWQASIPVGLYSEANLKTGRMLTTIPITGWGGRGPAVNFMLYHNQNSPWATLMTPIEPIPVPGGSSSSIMGDADGDLCITDSDVDPFAEIVLEPEQTAEDLHVGDFDASSEVGVDDFGTFMEVLSMQSGGPQWSHSYSARLIHESNKVTLIRDDGTHDVFNGTQAGGYSAQLGIYDTLTYDATFDRYALTSKSQWRAVFEANPFATDEYRLWYIADASVGVDASGLPLNRVTCAYYPPGSSVEEGRLATITDSNGLAVRLIYQDNESGRIKEIKLDGFHNVILSWSLLYCDIDYGDACSVSDEGAGALKQIAFPAGPFPQEDEDPIEFFYNTVWDITGITDKDGDTYNFEYTSGYLTRVIDPAPFNNQMQEFRYAVGGGFGNVQTTYTDRRQNDWLFTFKNTSSNLVWIENPWGHRRSFFYAPGALLHEVDRYKDPINREWKVSYDSVANVIDTTDPLNQKWAFEYSTDGLNNLRFITPPAGQDLSLNTDKQIELRYEDPEHPTQVTSILEPCEDPVAGCSQNPTTAISYYDEDHDPETAGDQHDWYGLVQRVIPPSSYPGNEFQTMFTYDNFGYLDVEIEGAPPPPPEALTTPPDSVYIDNESDSLGRNTGGCIGSGSSADSCGGNSYDAAGNVTGNDCHEKTGSAAPEGPGDPNLDPIVSCYPAGSACCPPPALPPDPFASQCGHAPLRSSITRFGSGCIDASEPPIYSKMGQLEFLARCVSDFAASEFGDFYKRRFTYEYDELGRMISGAASSNESTQATDTSGGEGLSVDRAFTYQPGWNTGLYTQTGPDGATTVAAFDAANRLTSYVRTDAGGTTIVSATLTYFDDDRLESIQYDSGATSHYAYDDAGRLTDILVQNAAQVPLHHLQYGWTADGLVEYITETDEASNVSTIDFTYDGRNRLIEEQRTGTHPYHMAYTYDAGGNRQAKEDLMAAVTTDYTYDVSDPGLYLSQGNRLMQSRAYDSVSLDPIETRWYVYDLVGRTTRVIQAIAGEDDANGQWYRATDLWYDTSGRLWVSRLQRYQLVEVGDPPQVEIDLDTRQFLAAMEYRYDSGRQRYMVRPRDAETLAPPQDGSGDYDLDVGAWHDYSGAAIYGDYAVEAAWDGEHQAVTAANVTETLAHEPAMVQYDRAAAAGEEQLFLHGNLVGTTERITDAQSAIAHRAVYTAFGEPVFPSPSQGEGQGEGTIPTRYGYVGAWGYQGNPLSAGWSLEGPGGLCDPAGPEAHCDPVALLGWLHVGERYYDPASGRFMQRDPIGTNGGLNVYAYVENLPTIGIDPDGLNRWLVQEQGLSLHHEGIILQITDTRWARIDFGSYSWGNGNNNVEIKFSSNPCSLLRHRDKIIRKRETTVDHDRKTIRKMVRKYGSKSYIFPFRICWTVAEKLFDDTPPTLPGRR